jgi:hypothetical protein
MTLEELTHKKFKHSLEVMSSQSFLNKDTLGGEIPFWIAPYDVKASKFAEVEIKNLIIKLSNKSISVAVVDLFGASCEIIEENMGLETMFSVEKKGKPKLLKALQSTINMHERLIPYIVKKRESVPDAKLMIIKGVGSVYPFIRSHSVLNNLHTAIKDIPTVLFFPGEYTGHALNLFGAMKDDNYYRAFNIDNQNIK